MAPILLLIRDAALADPDTATLQAEMDARRLDRTTHNARSLQTPANLRRELTCVQAGEIHWTDSSPQLCELLVLTRRWPLDRYGNFLADAMISALLPAAP